MPKIRWVVLAVVSFCITACAGPQQVTNAINSQIPPAVTPLTKTEHVSVSVINTARSLLGTAYRYGGSTPASGFDCSGLVSYAYGSVGVIIPRTSSEQFRKSEPVSLQNLQSGDLLFFRLRPPKVSHVAIYDRNGRFIHAPSSGKRVSYASLDNPYWRKHLVGAGRF